MRAPLLLLLLLSSAVPAEELDALFARAAHDPAAVAPLIAAGSAAVIALPSDQGVTLAERLTPFCARVFLSPEQVPGSEALGAGELRVEPKDSWSAIARRLRVGADLLQRLNPGSHLVPGHAVKVVDAASAAVSVVVCRHRFRLLAWRGRTLVACFPVAVGRPGHETPLGETRVVVRQADPEWTDPDTGHVFAGKDPGNLLGGFWLGFDALPTKQYRGIGMHGYTGADPSSWLGTASSHGCVRLDQEPMRAIFDLALPGTRVVVTE